MARRAKPPEEAEKKRELPGDRPLPPENANTMSVVLALAGLGLVIVLAGWVGTALVKTAKQVGEHEEVQKLERDVNDALRKTLPKKQ
jgi:hypothetical protein